MGVSVTLVLSSIFFLFIINSVWNIMSIFQTPTCSISDKCYNSYFNNKPTLDLYVFTSDNSRNGQFTEILHLRKFNYLEESEKILSIQVSELVRQNGSMFLHAVLLPSRNYSRRDLSYLAQLQDSTYFKSKLTKYHEPVGMAFNLLKERKVRPSSIKPVTHIRSKFALVMCPTELSIPHHNIPPEIMRQMRLTATNMFLPIIQRDIMLMRLEDLIEVIPSMTRLNITFVYHPVSFGKLRFILQIDSTLNQFLQLGFNEKDIDEIKNIFADSNLHLLCTMVIVGGIHILLDFLSMKNEVGFWRNQKTMAGLSTKAVFWRAFSQIIIFLYLLNENTSLLVLVPSGIAALIELWKVHRVVKVKILWSGGLKFEKTVENAEEKQTRDYEDEAMKYLSYILYPLCILAAIYSLLYQPHRSWYSWTINSLVNGVYAFGFIFMMPQLFINYRLKSVAALPWRAFMYRAFNVFIDDVFAFIISMPTSHRLACFRDDVVFLIYLYQRWLYPVDGSRSDMSEFETLKKDESGKVKMQ